MEKCRNCRLNSSPTINGTINFLSQMNRVIKVHCVTRKKKLNLSDERPRMRINVSYSLVFFEDTLNRMSGHFTVSQLDSS